MDIATTARTKVCVASATVVATTKAKTRAMTDIYELTLKAPDGRERSTLAWLPTEAVRQSFCEKANKNGLEIINNNGLHELDE